MLDPDVVACCRPDLALKPIGLCVGDNAGQAQDADDGEPASADRKRQITCLVTHRRVSQNSAAGRSYAEAFNRPAKSEFRFT